MTRLCAWCENPIPAEARRDAVCCSVRCRQARPSEASQDELISADPAIGAGVAFVRLESDPDPVRVRAGWVSDHDIRALALQCLDGTEDLDGTAPLAIEAAA